uniref:Rho-GAP domain-containing protein n=1 Tax=Nothoprocta perdicaria TaxID=30464 RepID=A0A8C6Z5U1_NOTPE
MDVLNLSRVFGPTLVGHGCANPTPLAIMEDTPRQCKVVARLLSLPPDFWSRFVGTERDTLASPPDLCSEPDPAAREQHPAQGAQVTGLVSCGHRKLCTAGFTLRWWQRSRAK